MDLCGRVLPENDLFTGVTSTYIMKMKRIFALTAVLLLLCFFFGTVFHHHGVGLEAVEGGCLLCLLQESRAYLLLSAVVLLCVCVIRVMTMPREENEGRRAVPFFPLLC